MYDNHTPDQLRDALALCDEQRKSAVSMLDGVRSELRLEKQRVVDLIREKSAAEVQVEDLTRDLNKARAEADLARTNWAADVETIGARLLDEAESRGWCSEFDEIVSDLNSRLHKPLAERYRDYDVFVEVRVTIPVTVSARSDDEARELASQDWRDRWESSDAADKILSGDVASSYDWEVEEVD